jgi:hypothetical protein
MIFSAQEYPPKGHSGLIGALAAGCLPEGSQRLSAFPIGEVESDLASLKQLEERLTE